MYYFFKGVYFFKRPESIKVNKNQHKCHLYLNRTDLLDRQELALSTEFDNFNNWKFFAIMHFSRPKPPGIV